jgi:hypothetical protein
MRKSFCWALPLVAALCACDDESAGNNQGKLQVTTEVCPNESAEVFVDGRSVFSGDATRMVGRTLRVPAGEVHVTVFVGGARVVDETLDISGSDVTKLTPERSVVCAVPDDGVPPFDDGSEEDAGADGSVIEPCSDDDDTLESARTLRPGDLEDALCSTADVDYFKFSVSDKRLATVRFSAHENAGLDGQITLLDAQGKALDVQAQGEGEEARAQVMLFEDAVYYVRVENLAEPPAGDAGVADDSGAYTLSLGLSEKAPVVEASAGTFQGRTNDEDVPGLAGTFVATSVRDADGDPVPYKVLVRVTLPEAEPEEFVFDPSVLTDGLLRVVFYDGTAPVQKNGRTVSLTKRAFSGFETRAIRQKPGLVLKAAISGEISVDFSTGDALKRTVDAAKLLAAPTVKSATASGDPTTLQVEIEKPEAATKLSAQAFGSVKAAKGSATPSADAFAITLDGKLEADEAFVIRVRAGDKGLLTLPLPEVTNLSEFIYYSDKTASEE